MIMSLILYPIYVGSHILKNSLYYTHLTINKAGSYPSHTLLFKHDINGSMQFETTNQQFYTVDDSLGDIKQLTQTHKHVSYVLRWSQEVPVYN